MLKLKNFREDNDYTQEDIAKILNCKQNTYQQYESEKRQIPIEALKKLALLYNTSIDYLVGLTAESAPYPRIEHKTD
ncbi:MAG: helix-turn-helix transcriptional regulator [Clostridia bacterium]